MNAVLDVAAEADLAAIAARYFDERYGEPELDDDEQVDADSD
jgi:hypothetical protein